jgi:hypothetical protein
MAKRKAKKKAIQKRLARRRGERSRKSVKRAQPQSTERPPTLSPGDQEIMEEALSKSALLLDRSPFRDLRPPADYLDSYLGAVKGGRCESTDQFVADGIRRMLATDFGSMVLEVLSSYLEEAEKVDPEGVVLAGSVLFALRSKTDPSAIPFFRQLFVLGARFHPLADDPTVWKLLYPLIPSRIVTPDDLAREQGSDERETTREEVRDEAYPHIVLPHRMDR